MSNIDWATTLLPFVLEGSKQVHDVKGTTPKHQGQFYVVADAWSKTPFESVIGSTPMRPTAALQQRFKGRFQGALVAVDSVGLQL